MKREQKLKFIFHLEILLRKEERIYMFIYS